MVRYVQIANCFCSQAAIRGDQVLATIAYLHLCPTIMVAMHTNELYTVYSIRGDKVLATIAYLHLCPTIMVTMHTNELYTVYSKIMANV